MSFPSNKPLRKRTIPMKVLNLSLSRTGTTSMKTALEMLGLENVYHLGYDGDDFAFWIAAIEAKFEGKGRPFGKEEWDHIFWDCDGISDLPALLFAPELISAYPTAKIIYTNRSLSSWYQSMLSTVCHPRYKSLYYRLPALWDKTERLLCKMSDKCEKYAWESDFEQYGKDYYEMYGESVKNAVKERGEEGRLLELEMGEGWERLCGFLGVEVPEVEFPKGNGVEAFREEADVHMRAKYRDFVVKMGRVVVPVLAVGLGVWLTW